MADTISQKVRRTMFSRVQAALFTNKLENYILSAGHTDAVQFPPTNDPHEVIARRWYIFKLMESIATKMVKENEQEAINIGMIPDKRKQEYPPRTKLECHSGSHTTVNLQVNSGRRMLNKEALVDALKEHKIKDKDILSILDAAMTTTNPSYVFNVNLKVNTTSAS